jgi:hypothetical protein
MKDTMMYKQRKKETYRKKERKKRIYNIERKRGRNTHKTYRINERMT